MRKKNFWPYALLAMILFNYWMTWNLIRSDEFIRARLDVVQRAAAKMWRFHREAGDL